MSLPASLNPRLLVGSEARLELRLCPNCDKKFVIEDGVIYQDYYYHDGVLKFGYLAFCDLKCLTEKLNIQGNS